MYLAQRFWSELKIYEIIGGSYQKLFSNWI